MRDAKCEIENNMKFEQQKITINRIERVQALVDISSSRYVVICYDVIATKPMH